MPPTWICRRAGRDPGETVTLYLVIDSPRSRVRSDVAVVDGRTEFGVQRARIDFLLRHRSDSHRLYRRYHGRSGAKPQTEVRILCAMDRSAVLPADLSDSDAGRGCLHRTRTAWLSGPVEPGRAGCV